MPTPRVLSPLRTALLPVLLAACISRPNAVFVATPAPDPAGVTGRYCYVGPYENVRVREPDSSIPSSILARYPDYNETRREERFVSLPLQRVARRSPLAVTLVDSTLRLEYRTRYGDRTTSVAWPVDAIEPGRVRVRLPNPRGGAAMGIGTSRRYATVTRGTNGRLVVVEEYEEKGLGLFVIPFFERTAWVADLDPSDTCDTRDASTG